MHSTLRSSHTPPPAEALSADADELLRLRDWTTREPLAVTAHNVRAACELMRHGHGDIRLLPANEPMSSGLYLIWRDQ